MASRDTLLTRLPGEWCIRKFFNSKNEAFETRTFLEKSTQQGLFYIDAALSIK
jgi:hypothetical protein